MKGLKCIRKWMGSREDHQPLPRMWSGVEVPKMNIRSILKEIQDLGSSHMTWKQKKELENRKIVSLGGKPPKKQRLPLSIALVVMKNQKHREEKLLRENEEITRFGGYSSRGANKVPERIRTEDRVLRSTEGYFKNGVLDVKHLLRLSTPRVRDSDGGHASSSKGKKTKGSKKGRVKRKGGGTGNKKRH